MIKDVLRMHKRCTSSVIKELKKEIAKGWDGLTSKRSVKDIISAKTKTTKV